MPEHGDTSKNAEPINPGIYYTEQGLETGSRDARINSQIFYRYRIISAPLSAVPAHRFVGALVGLYI